jgi:hypothetical protein
MVPAHVLEASVSLLVIPIVGRVVLSVLPPGPPGHHDLSSLPATWAASFLLGAIALSAQAALLDPPASDARMLIPWALLAVGRWITLPGAMEPRHEIRSEAPAWTAHLVTLAALIVGAWAALRFEGPWRETRVLPAASVVALLLVCGENLACARRAPLARALALLLLALLLVATPPGWTHLQLLAVGCGAAFAIPWLRRADRRACALSVISLSSAALGGRVAAGLAFAGLLGLCLHTPKPARATVATWSFVALLAFAALGSRTVWPQPPGTAPWTGALDSIVIVAALCTGTAWTFRRARPASRDTNAIDEPRREIAALRDMLLAGVPLALLLGASFPPRAGASACLPLVPVAVLLSALVLAPAESQPAAA